MSYITEDEAKHKWCPVMSVRGKIDIDLKPDYKDYLIPCQASMCMLWKWSTAEKGHCGLIHEP